MCWLLYILLINLLPLFIINCVLFYVLPDLELCVKFINWHGLFWNHTILAKWQNWNLENDEFWCLFWNLDGMWYVHWKMMEMWWNKLVCDYFFILFYLYFLLLIYYFFWADVNIKRNFSINHSEWNFYRWE